MQITRHSTNETSATAKFQVLEDEVAELRSKREKEGQIREEMSSRMETMTERKNKAEKRNDELLGKLRESQELAD